MTKMIRLRVLCTVLCLAVASPCLAAQIVTNGGIEDNSQIISQIGDSYNGDVDRWLTDGEWVRSNLLAGEGVWYARSGNAPSNMYQVTEFAGNAGDIAVDFTYQSNPYGLHWALYGSDTKPADGASWSGDTFNAICPFGESLGGGSFDNSPCNDDWNDYVDVTIEDASAYSWYTMRFFGGYDTGSSGAAGDWAKVDGVSVVVIPEPSCLILLVSGGLGLVLPRRQRRPGTIGKMRQ